MVALFRCAVYTRVTLCSGPVGQGPKHDPQDHHRHRPRPGRRRRHPAGAGSPDELEVLGITAVAGNVPLDLTARNARMVCELAGRRDIPVFAGCDRPLSRARWSTAEHVHGKTGLDGPDLPDTDHAAAGQARASTSSSRPCAREPPGTVTLCPLGPLTNIATALQTARPTSSTAIEQIVLMGGAYFEVGNITPAAEFNIYVDPEAADIVFQIRRSDRRHAARRHPQGADHRGPRSRRSATSARRSASPSPSWTDFFERFDMEKYGSEGAPLHDPCVIAYLLTPGSVHRPAHQRRDRDRLGPDPRHDRRRLVGRHRPRRQRHVHRRRRRRRVLRAADRAAGPAMSAALHPCRPSTTSTACCRWSRPIMPLRALRNPTTPAATLSLRCWRARRTARSG